MNQLKNEIDYSSFGGTRIDEKPIQQEEKGEQQKVDYSQFGGNPVNPPKEKVGKFKSTLLGVYEGLLGIPGLIQYGLNEYSKGLDKAFGIEVPEESFEEENPILSHLSKLPESEGQAARRFRVAGNVLPLSALGGIPGVVAGLVGSQAGQTVREVYGKEGKFDEFGLGEVAALGLDLAAGVATGGVISLAKSGARQAIQRAPAAFSNPKTSIQKKAVELAINQEKNALEDVVNNFSQQQLRGFEESAAAISPNRYTDLTQSNAAQLQQLSHNMFRDTQLNIISPLSATPRQAGTAIQDSANIIFRNEVLAAERQAYTAATLASEGLAGEAPRTLEEAKSLRDNLTRVTPTAEQRPVVAFLDGLISDLENASSEARPRTANELVDLVQRSNQAVNYGSELRYQSNRLAPIVATLREETGQILAQNPAAAQLYQEANILHGRNAEVWGTKYMRNVRFAENPENIVGQTKKASNMRNLKQAIQDPTIQGVAERAVVNQITEGGTAQSNRIAINNLSAELSPVARGSAEELINVKDPLTTIGGRAAVRNEILKDAAQSVNTGKKPTQILELMKTPKGYQIVRESMNGSPHSRELFRSFERLFMEDVVSSITNESGVINFSKARNVLSNQDTRAVIEEIGGEGLIRQFRQLENFSNNFERNLNLYSKPETQSLFKALLKESKSPALLSAILHSLHVPWPIIIGAIGAEKLGSKVIKGTYRTLQKKLLSNPRAMHYLERVSQATTTEELSKQLPRLIAELDKEED